MAHFFNSSSLPFRYLSSPFFFLVCTPFFLVYCFCLSSYRRDFSRYSTDNVYNLNFGTHIFFFLTNFTHCNKIILSFYLRFPTVFVIFLLHFHSTLSIFLYFSLRNKISWLPSLLPSAILGNFMRQTRFTKIAYFAHFLLYQHAK
jgi:hypothetical protein